MTKSALITGGAKRIGLAIARELAQSGYDIAIHYHRSQQDAEDAAVSDSRCWSAVRIVRRRSCRLFPR